MRLQGSLLLPFVLPALAAQSGWSAPAAVPNVNSAAASDLAPHVSADGLTLHLASYRGGDWDLWSATRPTTSAPWSTPQLEATLSQAGATDSAPFLRADGLELFFYSARSGQGVLELMHATRTNPSAPWGAPAFVTELNDPTGSSADLSLTEDGLTAFFLSTRLGSPNPPNGAIWTATRPSLSSPFGPATLVSELATPDAHRDPEITLDGLTIVFARQNPATRQTDVMLATRTNPASPFGAPVAIPGLAAIGLSLTREGNVLYLCQNLGAPTYYDVLAAPFEGLTSSGLASPSSAMALHYRDSASPGAVFAGALALGSVPGIPLGSRTVPLNPDPLFFASFGGLAGVTTGYLGVLDPAGEAQGSFAVPLPQLVGVKVWTGFLTLEATAPFGVKTISNAREIEIVP